MAALQLHQALFAPEQSLPPILAHTSPSYRSNVHVNRQLSSISTATLRTASNSDHFYHPAEPSFTRRLDPELSTVLSLLSRQSQHLDISGQTPYAVPLSFEGDLVTPYDRQALWERTVRRKLRRLSWARGILQVVIGAWAIYNAVRYFLAFSTRSQYRKRRIILLALGISAAVSLTLTVLSCLTNLIDERLRLVARPKRPHIAARRALNYLASLLLLGPAVVNLVFVFLWRRASSVDTLLNRCHWDIDVFWPAVSIGCDRSPAWKYWLAGAVVRLVLTAVVLVAYHLTVHHYDVTRQSSRRRRRSRPLSHMSSSTATMSPSTQSFHGTNMSSTMSPVSIAQIGRRPSITTSEGHTTAESAGSAVKHRPLRNSRSRLSSQRFLADAANETYTWTSAASPSRDREPNSPDPLSADGASSDSSEEEAHIYPDHDRYGHEVGRVTGAYSSLPSPTSAPVYTHNTAGDLSHSALSDRDLSSFAQDLRALVAGLYRETEEAVLLARNDQPLHSAAVFPVLDDDDEGPSRRSDAEDDYVPVLGRTVHRMPTIESLGSREVMSLASGRSESSVRRASPGPHHLSRPSTRSNNFSMSDAGLSTPSTRSRANSLDAVLALASPVEDGEETEIEGQGSDHDFRS